MNSTKPTLYSTRQSTTLKSTRHITNHVFATLTYARNSPCEVYWKRTTRDFNRFITYFRRLHRDGCEYLRTIEAHADGYPHIHCVLQIRQGLVVENGKYFDNALYGRWRSTWVLGHSDFQAPTGRGKSHPVFYNIKYISKNSTAKTIWRKVYAQQNAKRSAVQKSTEQLSTTPTLGASRAGVTNAHSTSVDTNPSLLFCKQYRIKQCTWSRGFKFPTLNRIAFPDPPQQKLN